MKEIKITDEIREWIIHITPKANYQSIKDHGLLRPDIVYEMSHNDQLDHISPYSAFLSSKKKHRPTRYKNTLTFFGQWGDITINHWKEDKSVVDNSIGLILKDKHYITSSSISNKLNSSCKRIPFSSFKVFQIASSLDKINKTLKTDYIVIIHKGYPTIYKS